MEDEAEQTICLKVLVEKEKNRVVFAEANKDFVDVLFSFMTTPIATIIALTLEHSTKGDIGCLSNIYRSVENLDEEYQQNLMCKDMLLHPRSAAEIYCRNLKLSLTERSAGKYYSCSKSGCNFVTCYRTADCRCGNPLDWELNLPDAISGEGVFLKPAACFMLSDDFQVMPLSTMTGLKLLNKLGASDGSIEERTVNLGRAEVLKLLKLSLTSKTPFSDTLRELPIRKSSFVISHGKYGPRRDKSEKITEIEIREKISLKLIVCKSKNRAVYAEAEEDFVDLLCSFLTFPLGYVFQEFPRLTFKGCIDNLYKSIQDLDVNKFFLSEEMKEMLVSPKLAPGLPTSNHQLIDINEAVSLTCSTLVDDFWAEPSQIHSNVEARFDRQVFNLYGLSIKTTGTQKTTGKSLMKGPSMFMVTDNLTITPLSPISGISLFHKMKISLSDIEEREVVMGEDEALRLLVASLVSSRYALTDAFILKEPKGED